MVLSEFVCVSNIGFTPFQFPVVASTVEEARSSLEPAQPNET